MNNTTAYVLPPFIFNINKPEREVAKIRAHGMCVFLLHSCINHSCCPSILCNTRIITTFDLITDVENRIKKEDKATKAKVIIRAIKPIKTGEEIQFTCMLLTLGCDMQRGLIIYLQILMKHRRRQTESENFYQSMVLHVIARVVVKYSKPQVLSFMP